MLSTLIALLLSTNANAWDRHQVIMQHLLDSDAAKRRIYPYQKITIPCPADEKKELLTLAASIHIQAEKVPLFSEGRCKPGATSAEIVLNELILGLTIDEPDLGMDQNLPDSDDPKHERKFMGGSTGPTSQAFRHMYLKGLELFSLLSTFQLPPGPMGQSLERIKLLHETSNAYFAKGDKFWGTRTLLWQIHYIQDLQQPFHTVQVPLLSFLPYKKLFSSFVKQSARTLGNYHYAYEGLTLALMNEASTNHFAECFEPEATFEVMKDPLELVDLSRSQSYEVASSVYELFGSRLKDESIDLANGEGAIDYFALLHLSEPRVLPEEEANLLSKDEKSSIELQRKQYKAVDELKRLTCKLIHRVATLTWYELDRSQLTPSGSSATSTSAKSAK